MASQHYELAAGARSIDPPFMASYRRVMGWDKRPERCQECRAAMASTLRDNRSLCRSCADPGLSEAMRQTRERQDRNDALRAEIERAEGLGIVGRAVPYGEPTEIRAGAYELFEPGAFDESIVPITDGHGGPVLVIGVRAFSLRDGLYFEADLPRPEHLLRRNRGLSIEFRVDDRSRQEVTERYRGGHLRRIRRARLTAIAMVSGADQPAYRSTWCVSRSPEAWKRVYSGTASLLRAAGEVNS